VGDEKACTWLHSSRRLGGTSPLSSTYFGARRLDVHWEFAMVAVVEVTGDFYAWMTGRLVYGCMVR
jgi:hypothetical protein